MIKKRTTVYLNNDLDIHDIKMILKEPTVSFSKMLKELKIEHALKIGHRKDVYKK